MKFAHISDCHLGGWREDSLRDIGMRAFERAIDTCLQENVGFILIAGDLFNTSLPSIDILKMTANILNKVREHDINVYVITGNHDYSASGKTMLDVLENAGLVVNVGRMLDGKLGFVVDKTGAKISGWHGKKGGLEKDEYKDIDFSDLEKESGFKIFMFHSVVEELKPSEFEMIECMSINMLPKNFNYYAGGDPHAVIDGSYNNGKVAYPGALFPNNFREIEKFKHGGFYIIDDKLNMKWMPVKLKDVSCLLVNAEGKTPKDVESDILSLARDLDDKIITLRLEGVLREGKPADIDYKKIDEAFSEAYCLLKNTSKLQSKETIEINVAKGSVEEIEKNIVEEYREKNKDGYEDSWINKVIIALDKEKHEGETNTDFQNRIVKDVAGLIGLDDEDKQD